MLPGDIFTDAHKTWLGAILCQGKYFENLKPVTIASCCTKQAEKNYAQLDLEAMAIEFWLCRLCSYLLVITKWNCSNCGPFSSKKHF